MNKKIWSLVPSCLTFGPAFMVITGAGFSSGHSVFNYVVSAAGAVILAIGLAAVFKTITKQQNLIEKLQAEMQPAA